MQYCYCCFLETSGNWAGTVYTLQWAAQEQEWDGKWDTNTLFHLWPFILTENARILVRHCVCLSTHNHTHLITDLSGLQTGKRHAHTHTNAYNCSATTACASWSVDSRGYCRWWGKDDWRLLQRDFKQIEQRQWSAACNLGSIRTHSLSLYLSRMPPCVQDLLFWSWN